MWRGGNTHGVKFVLLLSAAKIDGQGDLDLGNLMTAGLRNKR